MQNEMNPVVTRLHSELLGKWGEQLLPESAAAESKGKWIRKADGSTVHTAVGLTSLSLEPQGGTSRLVPHPTPPCTTSLS